MRIIRLVAWVVLVGSAFILLLSLGAYVVGLAIGDPSITQGEGGVIFALMGLMWAVLFAVSCLALHYTRRKPSGYPTLTGADWRLIEPGWTEAQIRDRLGGPHRIEPKPPGSGSVKTVWHYGRWWSDYRGRVEFLDGKVVGFTAPPPDARGAC